MDKVTHKNEEPYPYAFSSVEAESLLRHPPHITGKIILVLYMKVQNRSGVCIWSSIVLYYARQLNGNWTMFTMKCCISLLAVLWWQLQVELEIVSLTWGCLLIGSGVWLLFFVLRSFVFCLAIEQFATISTDSGSTNLGVTVGWSMKFYHLPQLFSEISPTEGLSKSSNI